MQNFQDTSETRKRSFITAYLNWHDCTFKKQMVCVLTLYQTYFYIERHKIDNCSDKS